MKAVTLYRAAIGAISLDTHSEEAVDRLSEAALILKELPSFNAIGAPNDLFRLRQFYVADGSGELTRDAIRRALAVDLADRNRNAKEELAALLERIDETYYYARGHGALADLAKLHRELIEKVEQSYRFPDLDVSDWLNALGGLLLNLDEIEHGERRIEQSLDIERFLSGERSERVAKRLQWRGSHFARRGWCDRAKADLERALEILVALPSAKRSQIEHIIGELKDIAPVSRVFSDLVRAYQLWRGFILREYGAAHAETAEASYRLSRAYEDSGQLEHAASLAEAACNEDRATVGPAGVPSARYLDHLAKLTTAAATIHETSKARGSP